jgi:putative sporulation protein YyaC
MFRTGRNRLQQTPFKIEYSDDMVIPTTKQLLLDTMQDCMDYQQELVIVCIGTDRSTGDALGPLVGTFVIRTLGCLQDHSIAVYGTLDQPVHAVNLRETLQHIQSHHKNPFILAVDACLGKLSSVGTISISKGPLKPGAGVNKDLPEVGDMHITGIVNVGGFMEYFVLQNTRLNLVMSMAECISNILVETIKTRTMTKSRIYPIESPNSSFFMQ